MNAKRKRRVKSIADTLVYQSRESALSAVQIFNNPTMLFKSESYIVLMMIAWTYLLHAHYRKAGLEYRYFRMRGKVKRFDTTKTGAYKFWSLTDCINCNESPLDKNTHNNLTFLIGLRNEIEHQVSFGLDDQLHDRYLACALNFNLYLNKLHGEKFDMSKHLTASIQFRSLTQDQLVQEPAKTASLTTPLQQFIFDFDNSLSEEELDHPRFTQNVYFMRKLVNRPGQADIVFEFLDPSTEAAQNADKQRWVIKREEPDRFLPKEIVCEMNEQGFTKFNMHHFIQLWKSQCAKDPAKGFGTFGTKQKKQWYWYQSWVEYVRKHCDENRHIYCE